MASFNFTPLRKKWKFLTDKTTQDYLSKWSLKDGLSIESWAFDQPYHQHLSKDLLQALLKLPSAREILPWRLGGIKPEIKPLTCSITSLEVFDRLTDPSGGIVLGGSEGEVRGCFEERVDGFLVNNLLQQMILNDENEAYQLYTKRERQEFLFKLFGNLIIGGHLCQYEDYVQPYIDVAATIYKNVVSVQRNKESNEVEIRSKCFSIEFPIEDCSQNFAYAIVDPGLREVTLLTHKF